MARRKPARIAPLLLLIECVAVVAIIAALAPHREVSASHAVPPTTPTAAPPPTTVPTTPSTTNPVPSLSTKQKAAITVRVGNATHVAQLAGTISSALSDQGFTVLAPTNAPSIATSSEILTVRQSLSGAEIIAKMLRLPESVIKVVSSEPKFPAAVPTDIAVYAGSNLAGFGS